MVMANVLYPFCLNIVFLDFPSEPMELVIDFVASSSSRLDLFLTVHPVFIHSFFHSIFIFTHLCDVTRTFFSLFPPFLFFRGTMLRKALSSSIVNGNAKLFTNSVRGITSVGLSSTSRIRNMTLFPTQNTSSLSAKILPMTFSQVKTFSSDSETSDADNSPRIAVILSGCGVFDGTEITEAVATLVHISAAGMRFACFAPDIPSFHVVDHTRGEPEEGENASRRNVYSESARIARGKILPLSDLDVDDFDALIFPGGFGAAKNLSNFAVKGHEMEVLEDIERVVRDFHAHGKPMGFMCISPIIASRVFGSDVALTVGGVDDDKKWPFHGAAHAIEAMGSKHVVTTLDQICIDKDARIVSSAAYMCGDAKPHQVFDNVGKLIDAVHELILVNKACE